MIFHINISATAVADLEAIHEYLSAFSADAADRNYAAIKEAALGLREFPRRYALAPESPKSTVELRNLTVGNYRIIYSIIMESVNVWRVVHVARKELSPFELS